MNYLGIDYGEKNIGLAIGDDELKIATPLSIVHNIVAVREIIKTRNIDKIVIGLALGTRGETEQTAKTREFAKNFPEAILIDERFTTRLGKNDASAAALILQTHLDRLK